MVKIAAAMPQNIDSILDAAEQREASDVFLQEDEVPRTTATGITTPASSRARVRATA